MSGHRQVLLLEIDKQFDNIDYCWHQGLTGFKSAQKSAKKIVKLLKLMYGFLFSTKDILEMMANRLSHLNNSSDWKLKNLLRDGVLSE